jgi:hypothetical protein
MQRAWLLVPLALGMLACRPDTHGRKVEVHVPAGSEPRVLQPHPSVEVEVPADEVLPRAVKTE